MTTAQLSSKVEDQTASIPCTSITRPKLETRPTSLESELKPGEYFYTAIVFTSIAEIQTCIGSHEEIDLILDYNGIPIESWKFYNCTIMLFDHGEQPEDPRARKYVAVYTAFSFKQLYNI